MNEAGLRQAHPASWGVFVPPMKMNDESCLQHWQLVLLPIRGNGSRSAGSSCHDRHRSPCLFIRKYSL